VSYPAGYPARGRWRFRNHTRDFDCFPTLESIGIEQQHPELSATLSCKVVDRGEGFAFQVKDEVRVTFAGERILAGHIATVTRGTLGDESDTPTWVLEVQDYTGKLSDAIVTRRRKRRKESARRRIRWILRYLTRRVWTLSGVDLSHVPDTHVEPYDYFGATIDEALSHVADELEGFYYIDLDNVFRWYQRTDAVPAPFDLDNTAPDYAATFPFREWSDTDDGVDLANAVLMEPEKRRYSVWDKDPTSIVQYGRHERFVSDSNVHRRRSAQRYAARALSETKDPATEASLVCWQPGLWAGMTVHVEEGVWGVDADRYVSAVSISAVDPHDEDDAAYLKTALTVQDRRHRRGHANRAINKNTRRRPGQHANVTDYVLDDFRRVVAPPSWTPGSAVGSFATYEASKGQTTSWDDIPFSTYTAALQLAASYVGAGYLGHTTEDCGCPGLDNCFKGWKDIERWYWLTVPAHPADMAGITVQVSTPALDGVAATYGAQVVVLSSQPTDTWQGGVVGVVGPSGGEVFIPGGLIPAAGGELHVGLQANWQTNRGSVVCGWVWPFTTGEEESGRYRASITTPVWQTFTAGDDDFGSAAVVADAPWDGGNAWHVAGTEGSPTAGIDGSAYYMTAASPSGHGLYMVGEREDDDEAWGPWSDCGWSLEGTFVVDVLGDTGTAGPRSIEVRTTGEGEQSVGTVWLGDSSRAPGISVGGPTTTVYAPVTLTAGDRWRFAFDTRSNKVRGKLWLASGTEPAAWDVETPMEETEDIDADRWTLWLRGGQAGDQTIRVLQVKARKGANDGQRVAKELIGRASGTATGFTTRHPYRPGTLRVYVNGAGVGPRSEDPDGAAFTLDFPPTARSILRASYTVDQGEGDD
jgi:hypothetical protein